MNEIDLYSQPSYDSTTKLYHITENYKENRLLKFKFREKPTDTPFMVHEIVNKLSMEKFKLPIRNLFFTYTKRISKNAMRVIPLGNNVQYFYHPLIEDFAAWFMIDVLSIADDAMIDYIDAYDLEVDIETLSTILRNSIDDGTGLKTTHDSLIRKFSDLMDTKHSTALTKNVLAIIVGELKSYIGDIVKTTDISEIPGNIEAEIMIYAPDDIYMIANKNRITT